MNNDMKYQKHDPIDPLVLAAYHESGHAVVLALQRSLDGTQLAPFESVTIRPMNDSSEYGNLIGVTRLRIRNYYSEVDVIAGLAGLCAEVRLDPAAYSRGGSIEDLDKADEILRELDLEDNSKNIDYHWDLCKHEVARAWTAIEEVANELLRTDTLTQDEVVAICEKHGIKYNYLEVR